MKNIYFNTILFIVACSCSKGAEFSGLSIPESPISKSSNNQEAAIPNQEQNNVTAENKVDRKNPPKLLLPPPKPVSEAFELTSPVASNSDIPVSWKIIKKDDFKTFQVFIRSSNQRDVLFNEEVEGSCTPASQERVTQFSYTISNSFSDGKYEVAVMGIPCNSELSTVTVAAPIVIDRTAPSVQLFLATDFSGNACQIRPTTRSDVATRTVPFDYCVFSDGAVPAKSCLRKTNLGAPALTDTCWTDFASLANTNLALLANGANDLTLYVKDQADNIGQGNAIISLNPGLAPTANLVSPSPSEINSAKWDVDQNKIIRWDVTDDDTPTNALKFIVSLIDAEDPTKFKHLACNFSNSAVWNLCPADAVPNATGFVLEDSVKGTNSFTIKVPAGWGSSKKFIVTIQTIDKSGNTSIISTQEINAGWEVIAGRTYSGMGGSAQRLSMVQVQSQSAGTSVIRTDSKGQIYIPVSRMKVRAFDGRTCRAIASVSDAGSAFDCEGMIRTNLSIYQHWTYDKFKDVFYAFTSTRQIVALDFNHGTVTTILGNGPNALSDAIPQNTDANSIQLPPVTYGFVTFMSFDDASRTLYFIYRGQMYMLNSDGKVSYVLGTQASATTPVGYHENAQTSLPQKDLVLTNLNYPFIVTKDQRVLLGGGVYEGRALGSAYGTQHLIENFSPANPSTLTSMTFLSSAVPEISWLDWGMRDLSYDAENNRIYGSLAWSGIFAMNLPAKGSAKSAYSWTTLQLGSTSFTALGESRLESPFYSYGVIYAGAGLYYFNNPSASNSVFAAEYGSGSAPERVVGMATGSVNSAVATNQILDFPMHLNLNASGEVIFNDLNRFFKVTIASSGNTITGLNSHGLTENGPFRVSGSKLYQTVGNDLFTYDLSNVNSLPVKTLNPASPGTPEIAYTPAMGMSSTFPNLKTFVWGSNWDAVQGKVSTSWLQTSAFNNVLASITSSSQRISEVNSVGLNYCGSNNQSTCTQGAQTGNYYSTNAYRLGARAGRLFDRVYSNGAVYAENDNVVYTCLSNPTDTGVTLAKIRLDNQRIYLFTAKDNLGADLPALAQGVCTFGTYNGEVYFTNSKEMYKINLTLSNIEGANTAIMQKVALDGGLPSKVWIGDMHVNATHIYFTDGKSNRVIRSKIQ